MKTTELPENIVIALQKTGAGLTAAELAEQLDAKVRTIRVHVRDLYDEGIISRRFEYVGEGRERVGYYRYFAKAKKS